MKPPRNDLPGRVCLAAFAGAFGVRGETRVKPFTRDPFDIAAYGALEDETGRTYLLRPKRVAKGMVIAEIEGVTTREAVDALKGTALYVARARLPDPDDEEEFYHVDLVGLEARLGDGTVLGQVTAVQDFGAGDLLDIRLAEAGRSVLVPFTREVVPNVSLAEGWLTVAPPVGLLDDPREARDEAREPEDEA